MSDVHDTSSEAGSEAYDASAVGTGVRDSSELSGPVIDLADRPALMSFLRDVVLQTEGVWRLEPTVAGTVASFLPSVAEVKAKGASALAPRRFDGISIQRTGASLDVTVDLATLWTFAAVDVARVVQGRLHEALVEAGVSPGLIDITVLAVGSD